MRHSPRRFLALSSGAALLVSLAATTIVAPVAASESCRGVPATIVGTSAGEVIEGTSGRDVIVGRGGHDVIYGRGGNDLICGGLGNDRIVGNRGSDRIFGNAGRDRIFGGLGPDTLEGGVGDDLLVGRAGNDSLDGGPGTDRCYQNLGNGPKVNCEFPVENLAIAYSDLNGNHRYDAGDVLISKLTDTNGDLKISAGDKITMGRYPTKFDASALGDWGVKSHTVASVESFTPPTPIAGLRTVLVTTPGGAEHMWAIADQGEFFGEGSEGAWSRVTPVTSGARAFTPSAPVISGVQDGFATSDESWSDVIMMSNVSPSQPATAVNEVLLRVGDDRFIDVEIAS